MSAISRENLRHVVLVLTICSCFPFNIAYAITGDEVIKATGVEAGLCVSIGVSDGVLEGELTNKGRMLVHGLAFNQESLNKARAYLTAQSLYGIASVEKYEEFGRGLPYAENLANLVVCDLDNTDVTKISDDEIMRIVAPLGAAYIKKGGSWSLRSKPRPPEYADWTQFSAGPEGNGMSNDRAVKIPTHLKWQTTIHPNRMGSNPAAYAMQSGVRIAGNRAVFEMLGERKGAGGALACFDAFSGVYLWKVAWQYPFSWIAARRYLFTVDRERVYVFLGIGKKAVALDINTGKTLLTYDNGLACDGGSTMGNFPKAMITVAGDYLIQTSGKSVTVLDKKTGAMKWTVSKPDLVVFPTASAEDNRLFVATAGEGDFSGRTPQLPLKSISGFELSTGNPLWSTSIGTGSIGWLIYDKGYLVAMDNTWTIPYDQGPNGHAHGLDATNGKVLWNTGWQRMIAPVIQNGIFFASGGAIDVNAVEVKTGKSLGNYSSQVFAKHNQRCNRMTATPNYLINGYVSWINADKSYTVTKIMRSGCAVGLTPANGMIYNGPSICRCFSMVHGYAAFSSEPVQPSIADNQRVRSGGAQTSVLQTVRESIPFNVPVTADWDYTRNGPEDKWRRTTDSVSVNGLTYISVTQEHRLEARKADRTISWTFIADGRITSAPLIVAGNVYIASHNGWVYSLRASDGALNWRFLAAPYPRYIVSSNQVESAWPVYAVYSFRGSIICLSGLHAQMGGGMIAWGLKPENGTPVWKKVIYNPPESFSGNRNFENTTDRQFSARNELLSEPIQFGNDTLLLRRTTMDGNSMRYPFTIDGLAVLVAGTKISMKKSNMFLHYKYGHILIRPERPINSWSVNLIAMNGRLISSARGSGLTTARLSTANIGVGMYTVTLTDKKTRQTKSIKVMITM